MALKARLLLSVAIVAMSSALVAESLALFGGRRNPGDQLLTGQNLRINAPHPNTVLNITKAWPKAGMTRYEVVDVTPEGQLPAHLEIINISDPDTLKLRFVNDPGSGIFYDINLYYKELKSKCAPIERII